MYLQSPRRGPPLFQGSAASHMQRHKKRITAWPQLLHLFAQTWLLLGKLETPQQATLRFTRDDDVGAGRQERRRPDEGGLHAAGAQVEARPGGRRRRAAFGPISTPADDVG